MGKEYSKSATERGQFMIADAIRKLSGSSDESLEFGEFNKDATEYGQKAIVDAINGLSNGEGGSLVTVDTEITEESTNPVTSSAIYEALQNTKGIGFKINVTQSEHQTITYSASVSDLYFCSSDGNYLYNNPPSNGGEFRLCVSVALSIQADNGYIHGDWVVTGEVPVEHGSGDEYQSNYYALVFLGDTLNVSATPATQAVQVQE